MTKKVTKAATKARRSKRSMQRVFLLALEANMGIVQRASRSCNIPRETHYRWIRTDPAYKAKIDELNDIALDFAEGALHDQIAEGSTAATIFYLKTKGKQRGYIEKTELDITAKTERAIIKFDVVRELPEGG